MEGYNPRLPPATAFFKSEASSSAAAALRKFSAPVAGRLAASLRHALKRTRLLDHYPSGERLVPRTLPKDARLGVPLCDQETERRAIAVARVEVPDIAAVIGPSVSARPRTSSAVPAGIGAGSWRRGTVRSSWRCAIPASEARLMPSDGSPGFPRTSSDRVRRRLLFDAIRRMIDGMAKPNRAPSGRPTGVVSKKRVPLFADLAGKPVYDPDRHPRVGRNLALLGLIDERIAEELGVSTSHYYEMRERHPEFDEAIRSGKAFADADVAAAVYRAAAGFKKIENRPIVIEKGVVEVVPVEVHVDADGKLGMQWLRQRQGGIWRERVIVEDASADREAIEAYQARLQQAERDDDDVSTG
jgi:hypothetical protein